MRGIAVGLVLVLTGSSPVVGQLTVSETRVEAAGGTWDITTKVCNHGAAAKEVAWWTWPRSGPVGAAYFGTKMDNNPKYHPVGTAPPRHATPFKGDQWPGPGTVDTAPGGVPGALGARQMPAVVGETLPGGAAEPTIANARCVESTTNWPARPVLIYVRVFERKNPAAACPGEGPTVRNWCRVQVIAHNVHYAAACLPSLNPPARFLANAIPIPYTSDLGELTNRPLRFFIRDVSLPSGWDVAFMSPQIDEDFVLQADQREFDATLLARIPPNPLPTGRAVVEATWGVRPDPAIESILPYEQTVRNVIIRDQEPPDLSLSVAGNQATLFAQDPGGIHELPRLTISAAGTEQTVVMPLGEVTRTDPESAIGITEALYQAQLPIMSSGMTLTAALADQCGNLARTAPQTVGVKTHHPGRPVLGHHGPAKPPRPSRPERPQRPQRAMKLH